MRINKIKTTNYKDFKDQEIAFVKNINFILSENKKSSDLLFDLMRFGIHKLMNKYEFVDDCHFDIHDKKKPQPALVQYIADVCNDVVNFDLFQKNNSDVELIVFDKEEDLLKRINKKNTAPLFVFLDKTISRDINFKENTITFLYKDVLRPGFAFEHMNKRNSFVTVWLSRLCFINTAMTYPDTYERAFEEIKNSENVEINKELFKPFNIECNNKQKYLDNLMVIIESLNHSKACFEVEMDYVKDKLKKMLNIDLFSKNQSLFVVDEKGIEMSIFDFIQNYEEMTILRIYLELIYRSFVLLSNNLPVSGLVFIDGLLDELGAERQKEVVQTISETFPDIQFFIKTNKTLDQLSINDYKQTALCVDFV